MGRVDDDRVTALAWGALMPGVRSIEDVAWIRAAVAAGVESVCLFGDGVGSPDRVRATVAALRAVAPDLLICLDEEGGEVTRVEATAGSSLLSARALGVVDDVAVTAAQGRLLGRLLRSVGVDWTLAPVADVNVDPRNPVIGVRSFGADPERVAAQVAATVAAVQSVGVITSPKHFPGHGDTHVDSHEDLPTLAVDTDTLGTRELRPFAAALDAGCASVMTAHLLVPSLDPTSPATLSHAITTGLLRERMGFDGVVITDAVEMGAVAGPDGARLPAAVVAALAAGADVVCIGAADQERALAASGAAVLAALAAGTLDVAVLEAAARRRAVLRAVVDAAGDDVAIAADVEVLARAAAASVEIDGDPRIVGDRIAVLTVAARPGYAAGPTGWQIAARLRDLGVVAEPVATAQEATGPLLIEVRDAWKDPALLTALAGAVSARPDAVVVDVGWPTELPGPVRGRIRSYGTGSLSATVAACAVTGSDPVRAARTLLTRTFDRVDPRRETT